MLLTAVTTILGLIPMVTGVSVNFRKFEISMVSETSQYWQSMSTGVIFGLALATMLTLVVVPILYWLFATAPAWFAERFAALRRLYWKPFRDLQGMEKDFQ